MNFKFILLLLLSFCGSMSANAKAVTSLIKGSIVSRDSKAILLMKFTDDPRTSLRIRIPITNNKFEYKLTAPAQEAYKLIFEDEPEAGGFKPVIFFPDTSVVQFTLHPMMDAEDKNIITGGKLNRSYQASMASLAASFKTDYIAVRNKRRAAAANKTYYTSVYDSLRLLSNTASQKTRGEINARLMDMEKTGTGLTPAGLQIMQEEKGMLAKMYNARYAYINGHADAVSYFMLYEDTPRAIETGIPTLDMVLGAHKQLAKAMPNHPYTKLLDYKLKSLHLQPGQPFIDFSAPDMNHNVHKLSSLIKGKVTLLDLWASWCGPCIAKTRQVSPVYEEFKGKGFQIVGVAREFKDLENLKIALAREKHPWTTLVDLEGKLGIWDKYGLDTSGGGMVLFDQNGTILAMNPTAEQLKEILKKIL
jgi:thiol-disulfide isomerase/thioredoxin